MALRTASVTGVSSDTATWGGAAPPVSGDQIVVNTGVTVTQDANLTFGTSGAAGTVDMTMNGSAQWIVSTGFTLTHQGDIRLEDTSKLTVQAGAHLKVDSSAAAGTPVYKLEQDSDGVGGQNMWVEFQGTSGSRCTYTKAVGSGNWTIGRAANAGSASAGITATYTDFSDGGNTSSGYDNAAIEANPIGASQKFYLDNCTFTRCGAVESVTVAANRDLHIKNCTWTAPLIAASSGNPNLWLRQVAATSGERTFQNNSNLYGYVAITLNHNLYTFRNNWLQRWGESGFTTFGNFTLCKNNVLYARTTSNGTSTVGVPGDVIENLIGAYSNATEISGSIVQAAALGGNAGTVEFRRMILGSTTANEEIDLFSAAIKTTGNVQTAYLSYPLVLLNSRGAFSGGLSSAHASALVKFRFEHITGGTFDNDSPSGNAFFCVNVGTDFLGKADMVTHFRYNLIGAPGPLTQHGYAALQYSQSSTADSTRSTSGTAANTSTTTQIDCTGKNWIASGTQQMFVDAGAKCVITAKRGTGPNVGEVQNVSNNDANSVMVASAFSATPDTTTDFKVFVLDTYTSATCGANVFFNVRDGTIYSADGYSTPTTVKGYNGLVCTTPAEIGAGDTDLGTVNDMQTEGPKFYDPTRTFWTWASEYLYPNGLIANVDEVWTSGNTYTVGARVSAQTASFYGNKVLWYYCYANKGSAAAAADKPGSGANWQNYWIFDSMYQGATLAAAGTTITDGSLGLSAVDPAEHMHAWVRRGFAPRNSAVGTAADGFTNGAVPLLVGGMFGGRRPGRRRYGALRG